MEKTYELSGCKLVVVFKNQLIRIKKPKALQKFLTTDIEQRSEVLVNSIKIDYLSLFGKELAISNDSLIIEIWAHVYASYFAKAMKNLISLKLVEEAADFIIKRSDIIDCGESEIDSNRKFWDILANFKGVILTFLPKRLL
ncbi:hypothetical protein [Pedobacter planticolens]|uniref:hypothetical protein n=1 Tax=Pedobacter planticolens TaxID=2679964 RepID=UPI001932D766|nr:hypothetical protein [Pedobacter planticolens]